MPRKPARNREKPSSRGPLRQHNRHHSSVPVASRKTVLNLTALGIGMVFSLLLLEGLTRWFVPDPDLAFENRLELFVSDPQVGFRNRGSYRGWAQGAIEVRTNAMGFRGPEVQIQKSPDTKRILGVGDSVAFGTGVREPDVFLRQLERNANAGGGRGQRVEVVNLSVIGYSLRQELLALKKFGLPLSPDIVLVCFVLNDAFPTEDPFFNVNNLHTPPKLNLQRRVYEDPTKAPSYAYRWGMTLLQRWRQPAEPKLPPRPIWPANGYEMQAWPSMQEDFRELKRLAAGGSFRLGVLLFSTTPQLQTGAGAPAHPQRMIGEFLRAEGIPYLDLYNTFRPDPRFFLDEMHLSPSGHAAAAKSIGQFIRQQGW